MGMGCPSFGSGALIIKWWWPELGYLTPAGATPIFFKPNTTVTGEVTVAPLLGLTIYTVASLGAFEMGRLELPLAMAPREATNSDET